MNERIKRLADNATHYANGVCDTDPNADWYETRDQKFAELIVKECIRYCSDNLSKTVSGALKMHFGVEERDSTCPDCGEASELSMVPMKRTVWVNLYSDGEAFYHYTQKEADDLDSEAIAERIGGKAYLVEIEA